MTITLAEALPLRKTIERRIQELTNERNQSSVVTIEKGETWEPPVRSVDLITTEIEQCQKDYRTLINVVASANSQTFIDWDNGQINLTEALELSKQMRVEVDHLKRLGNRKKQERQTSRSVLGNSSSDLLTVATYEPEAYRNKALKKERQVNKLSGLIERQNHFVELSFDASKYMD